MADFYVDANGNISKKKKKETKASYTVDASGNITAVKEKEDEDIAPVKETAEKERTWFQAGAFEDGYQFGDVFRTVVGTASDIGTGVLEGIGRTAEGVIDAGAYLLAGGADLVGADTFADDVRKVAQKDEVGALFESIRKNNPNDDNSILGEKSRGVTNALGQILTAIGTGGMAAGAGAGAGAVTAATTGMLGVSSAGAGISEAYKGGATDAEATAYGISKGVIDATSELIFGGLGKAVKATGLSHGISSLDDVAAKALSDRITARITDETVKRVAGNVTEYGVKASAEGLEEVIAGIGTIAAKKLTYMSEEDIVKIYEDENLLEQFIVGAVTSGIAQAPGLVSSTKADEDFVTGRTSNEEAVIAKEVENRISEEEADGTKLTTKQKAAIEKQVESDLEKGYISTDTIEEVLGGETYTEYKSTVDSEDALAQQEASLREEFNTLNRMKAGEMTGEQTDRREELRSQLSDISAKITETKANSRRDELKTRLSEEVSARVRGDRLSESYAEQSRRKEAFAADLDGYSGAQRKVVESAVKSGILNNTRRTHEFVEIVSKISADKGVLFDFTNNEKLKASGFAMEGRTVNGFVTKDGITLNMDSTKAWESTVGHEVTHVLEGTEVYTELQEMLFDYARSKGDYQGRYDTLSALYKDVEGADVNAELTADLVGDYLFTDTDFINNLSVQHRNIFQRIYDEIKYLAKVVTAGSKEARQIEKVKRAFEKAYREGGKVQGDVQYSLTDTSGRQLSEGQQEFFKDSAVRDKNGNLKVMYHGTAAGGHTVFDPYGKARYGLFGAGSYFTDNPEVAQSYTKKGRGTSPQVYETYLNIKNPIDMDAQADAAAWAAAMPDVYFPQSGTNEDFYRAMEEYFEDAEYPRWEAAETAMGVIEGMGFDGITHIGGGRVNADGVRHQVYIAFQPEQIKAVDNAAPTSDPDIRYSLSEDSEGRRLTEAQAEYFKESKAVDDGGNLMVMYHGTQSGGFHVFDPAVSDDGISLFFTDRNDIAMSYSGTSETYAARTFKSAADFNAFFSEIGAAEYNAAETDGRFILLEDGDEIAVSDTAEGLYEEFRDWSGLGYGDVNYKVYLNLANPYIVEADGHYWNDLRGWIKGAYVNTDNTEVKSSGGEFRLYRKSDGKEIQGGNIAVNPFSETMDKDSLRRILVDKVNNILSIKHETSNTTRDVAKWAKGNGYDGVIFRNIMDGGQYSNGSEGTATVAIAFSSEQVKSVDNLNPTADADIRFSLSEKVEETKDLIAVHNLNAEKLLKSLNLGGLPMPSIAIARAQDGHEGFGDISLIFSKDTIDPERKTTNKVYSGDAWTPTYPRVEYKVNEQAASKVRSKYYDLTKRIGYDEARAMYRYAENLDDSLNRDGGEAAMLERLYDDTGMMQIYLQDIGRGKIEPITREVREEITPTQAETNQHFIDTLGIDLLSEFAVPVGMNPMKHRRAFMDAHDAEIRDAYKRMFTEKDGFSEADADEFVAAASQRDLMHLIKNAYLYTQNRGVSVRTVTDTSATNDAIRAAAADGYIEWVDGLFRGVQEKSGIRNQQDLFTKTGNRRSFEATHYEETLENVVLAMKESGEKGIGGFGGGNIFGASTQEFGSITDVKKASERLKNLPEEEFDRIKDGFRERFAALARSLPKNAESYTATDDAANMLVEAVAKYKTKSGMANYLRRESEGWANYSPDVVDDLIALVNDIRAMPTQYFEAKPQRAVGFDEVGVFVIPRDADAKLKQELLNRGYSIAEYDPDVEGDRSKVVNSFEQYKFSLSDAGAASSGRGTPLRDLRLETAPVQEDIAPVAETAADVPATTVGNVNVDDYAPYSEAEASALRDESLAAVTDADVPPEMDAPYYGEEDAQPEPADPFEERDMKAVGNRSVKAYMYENPEVKPFFQTEANVMLGELTRTVKGEKTYTEGDFGGYGAESNYQWTGTKRHTSDDIAYLRDSLNYSYAEIEKGLKAIIEDDGKENNAVSKRIEFLLNDRLLKGYRDMDTGYEYEPNPDYVRMLSDKQILEYSEEARARFFENADAYVPPVEEVEDIAPVRTDTPPAQGDTPTVGRQVSLDGEAETDAEPTVTRKALHESIVSGIKERFAQSGFDFDAVLKNAKDLSTFATVDNTPQRVFEKSLGYKQGQILSDATVNKAAQRETEGIRWLNSFTDRNSGLLAKISREYGIKPGTRKSAAAQMYAEGFYVDGDDNIIAYGDAELAADFPNVRVQERIKGLARDTRIRRIYDETLDAINASRKRNAYTEIPRLDNYFLHFRAMEDTFSRLGLPFNPNDIRAKDLPTDLNGVTADLKPGQPYFASAMHRTGKRTSFDLLGGLEKYLGAAKNQIYHIDDIQTLRALRNYIADTYGQAHGLENLDTLSDEEAEARIKEIYDSHLSTMAKFLNEEANVLAGKTSLTDRGLEGIIGRRGITFLDTLNRQVGANMVGFNVSSSLTNFLSVMQAAAKTSKYDVLKAFTQTAANRVGSIFGRNDGFAEASPVIIRRRGIENFYRTPWQKASDAGYVLMSAVDSISTELIARVKYNELTRKGMDAQTAHVETDKWVSRLMGDRSLGQQPQLYNSKMLGLITKFQLEVRNQLDSQFYDTIQEAKASTEEIQNGLARNAVKAAKITSTLVQLSVLQHVFGKAFEAVAGYNPAFDIIEAIIKVFGLDDEEDDEDTVLDNIEQGFLSLLGDLPYTSVFTGGRVPIESALPIKQFVTGKDSYGNEKSRWETLGEAAPYYLLPGGYGQIKKTVQGLGMFDDEHPVSGSYTDSGNLRFPVADTPANRAQAAVFGQWASGNARDYFEGERKPLQEKQIEEFMASGMSIQDYWDYREGLSDRDKLADKAEFISGLDLPIDTKNLLINNIADRKEPIDMTEYSLYGDFEEFDYAQKNPEKYAFLKENNISYAEYAAFDEDTKEAWTWAYNNPEGFALSKAAAKDVVTYRKYAGELNDITADKDADGNSISGSRKEKVIDYINDLDAEYGEKIILFKNEYNADDTYNNDIIEYLDSREDISYEEMVVILTKLGFRVSGSNVTW